MQHLFLTSAGLSDDMKERFFRIIGKEPKDVKILYIPTAAIETDGAREGIAICFHELSCMGIPTENILVYNLELLLSKDYKRTYSSYVSNPHITTRLLTAEELQSFDAVFVSGGECTVLCREMVRTGFDTILKQGVEAGLVYVGIACFGLSLVFQLVTLPVEYNASSRALAMLGDYGLMENEETRGCRKVLSAAALTYVAAAASSILQLLRLILLFGNNNRRRD